MSRRAVYTIRDHEGWVRYVGSSGLPEGRFASHLNSDTPLGVFMRKERSEGREVFLHTEEWLSSKAEGFEVEKAYIRGYSQLSGDKLFNRLRPKGCSKLTIDPREKCMREGCVYRKYHRGLCRGHYDLFQKQVFRFYTKLQRNEYDQRCVDAGLILKSEPESVEVSFESIAKELKAEVRNSKANKKPRKSKDIT